MNASVKIIWLLLGLAAFLLGLIGAFLPILPTVPFMLLAAFFFARSSERLHRWILAHPYFGQSITDWTENGVIGRRAKIYAGASLIASFALSLWFGVRTEFLLLQLIILGGVAVFILSRPEG
jgi:uncharacterized protein